MFASRSPSQNTPDSSLGVGAILRCWCRLAIIKPFKTNRMNPERTHIGVDVGKDKLNFAYMQDGIKWLDGKVSNSVESIDAWLANSGLTSEAHFVFESTGTYSRRLEYCLRKRGIVLTELNPARSAAFTKAEGIIAKTDKNDARMLCRYGKKIQPEPTAEQSEAERELKQWQSYLHSLEKERSRLNNRLHAMSFDPYAIPKILEKLQASLHRVEDDIQEASSNVTQLAARDHEREMKLAMTVVGIGITTATKLVSYGGGFKGYSHVKPLLKHFGLAVVLRDSGNFKSRGAICRTGCGELRACLYMAARSAIRHNKECKDLYLRLRAKGKPHKVAMVAVCQKLVKQVFGIIKSGIPFDNSYQEKKTNAK